MKFFLDFFPLAVFVGVYSYSSAEHPIYPAVQALMVATIIQTLGSRFLTGKFEKLHLWTLAITLAFGGLTLVFRNPEFVQWKASIVVWLMAGVFLFRQWFAKKYLIQEMMKSALEESKPVPQKTWRKLNMAWPFAYIVFGFLNLYVAYSFSEAFWVKFKLFGLLGLTLLLIGYTLTQLYPYLQQEENLSAETPDANKNPNVIDQERE